MKTTYRRFSRKRGQMKKTSEEIRVENNKKEDLDFFESISRVQGIQSPGDWFEGPKNY